MRWSIPLVMVLVSLLAMASAQAQSIYSPPGATLGAEASSPPPVETVSYGRTVAKVDAVAGGLMLGAIVTIPTCFDGDCRTPLYLLAASAGTYSLGPAIVHISEGQPLQAGASVALRLGLPVLGGMALSGDDGGDSGLGVALGMGGAILIDWLVLSKKTRRVTPKQASWSPTMTPTDGGAAFGIAGSF